METHRAIEILELHVSEWTDFDDPGVIDQDVDLAEMLQHFLNGRLDLLGIEKIAFDRQDVSPIAGQIILGALQFFWIAGEKGNFSSVRANLFCDLQTQPARAAGNEGDFV